MNTTEYTYLIKNLKYYRRKKCISQEKLAELADLSTSYIKQIESGKHFKNISFITLSKLARALDIEMSTLLDNKIQI